jgi:hypothetical protein
VQAIQPIEVRRGSRVVIVTTQEHLDAFLAKGFEVDAPEQSEQEQGQDSVEDAPAEDAPAEEIPDSLRSQEIPQRQSQSQSQPDPDPDARKMSAPGRRRRQDPQSQS